MLMLATHAVAFIIVSGWTRLVCSRHVPRVPLGKQELAFKALCVLDEAIEDARAGKVRPSPGLRLALAFLYAVGDRRGEWFDREPYVEFWRAATQDDATGGAQDGIGRRGELVTSFRAIARTVGCEYVQDIEYRRRRGG